MDTPHQLATFAAGCFWGIEHHFAQLPGVTRTRVGYTGGHVENPTYEAVCSDTTGHAEAVEVTFNPQQISYQTLLHEFWQIHDPTQHNRQGPDVGSQYRSVIFTHTTAQNTQAVESLEAAQSKLSQPIATQIQEATPFWPAEDYHQQFYAKRWMAPACKV